MLHIATNKSFMIVEVTDRHLRLARVFGYLIQGYCRSYNRVGQGRLWLWVLLHLHMISSLLLLRLLLFSAYTLIA